MKKVLALIMILMMCMLSFAACGSESALDDEDLNEDEIVEEELEEDSAEGKAAAQAGSDAAAASDDISGIWADEIAQRASIEIEQDGDGGYSCIVYWSESYDTMNEWHFSGTLDGGILTYDAGTHIRFVANENEEMVEDSSEECAGMLVLSDGKLTWTDTTVESEVVFVRAD